jgi:hypothetical protein
VHRQTPAGAGSGVGGKPPRARPVPPGGVSVPRRVFRGAQRRALLAGLGALSLRSVAAAATASASAPWTASAVPAGQAMRQLCAGGPSGLLGVSAGGGLWALSPTGQAAHRIAQGLDETTPLAVGHGRIAARTAGGGLWVHEGGAAVTAVATGLAPHAGLLVLPLAVVAVAAGDALAAGPPAHWLVRLEPDAGGRWREVARSHDAVLPDARPLQVDLDGRGDGGHVAVLAGPDASRYTHGVLGDAVEATRLLWLERHGLTLLRALDLPAPYVFEDIAPRPVRLPGRPGGSGLLTVRSGPDGGQLALVAADPARPQGLHLAALGEGVGGFHRWLAPTTDGRQMAAVHTPHLAGVLHSYEVDGQRLVRRRRAGDVSTHHIGSRELDLAVWLHGLLVLPSQDGLTLQVLDPAADWVERSRLRLPARLVMAVALAGAPAMAALLDDGRVLLVRPATGPAVRG